MTKQLAFGRKAAVLGAAAVVFTAVALQAGGIASVHADGPASTPTPAAQVRQISARVAPALLNVSLAQPELVVEQTDSGPDGAASFVVVNTGEGYAVPFRIAVLWGASSFSINAEGIASSGHRTFEIPGLTCQNGPAVVIADADIVTHEVDTNHNAAAINGSCALDGGDYGGSAGVPASN